MLSREQTLRVNIGFAGNVENTVPLNHIHCKKFMYTVL